MDPYDIFIIAYFYKNVKKCLTVYSYKSIIINVKRQSNNKNAVLAAIRAESEDCMWKCGKKLFETKEECINYAHECLEYGILVSWYKLTDK